jgi:WD40 repeat protein/serine/threonine protein kinase
MSKLKLNLLSSPLLEINNTPIELERRKAVALLAYLAVTEKSHSRDSLAALLWPEADQSRARTSLRHNLWTLNKALDDGWLDISRETVGLKANPDLWVDVHQFRLALAACQTHDHTEAAVCPDCLPHLREAVSLYRDDFLTGFTLRDSPEFDEWQRFQTEALRRELTEALERLVRGLSAREDFKAAIPYAQRWLALDPLHEPAHRQLMELYARAGQRAAALHQYAECERILQEELDVPPSMETTALAERIRLETEGQQGQLIKSYELQELIGAGGFGEVYRAYQPQVRREVAIKVILPQYANQPEFIRRFEAEAQVVAQLEHPHIVPLYDFWREPEGAYLVMRWLRGGTLAEALKDGLWQPQATAQLLDQIAAALMLAHQRGIVHRDLKPANILLDETGHAYLSDFGIAQQVTTSALKTSPAGYVLASPAYAPPELINDERLTPQTDIYSLGVILYETLTGGHPFPDTTPPMMIIKHMSEPLPSLRDPRPDLPAGLDDVIQQATAKKPADRYADVLSLARDFRRALGSEQVSVTALPDESTPLLVPNPYKGLHAFQEGDAADFFGRDILVDQLLIRLTLNRPTQRQSSTPTFGQLPITSRHNFLAIVGPSGSGKSSLVKAGLIPALRQNAIPGSKDWFIVDLTPGLHPLQALGTALLRIAINPPPTLLDQLRSDERGLLKVVKRILPDEESRLLLVIDQFEEVFTLVEDEAARSRFLDSLYAAVIEPDSRLQVVITLRADFYDRPLLYPGFGDLLRQRMETVLPLTSEELEQAIAGPAKRVGATLETGLMPLIVSDVQEQPGTLPLMQYALTELYKRRQGRRLTLDGYQASGGVLGALARRADELYTELDDAGRAATRRLFLRLVTVGEAASDGHSSPDTRRRVLRSELSSLVVGHSSLVPDQIRATDNKQLTNDQEQVTIESIIDTFGQYRLLTFDRDPVTRGPTVEVAHEALIREWDRLRQWLDKDREFLMWQQRLRAGLHQWEANEQDEGALLRGAPLAEAENWLSQRWTDLNETEQAFIQASLALRKRRDAEREQERQARERLRRRITRGLVAGLAIAIVLLVLAGWQWQTATRERQIAVEAQSTAAAERDEAENSLSRQLAVQALTQMDNHLDLALLLSVEAARTADTPEARGGLLSVLDTNRQLTTYLRDHTDPVRSVAFSPDGKTMASGSNDTTIILWDISSRQPIGPPLTGHTDTVRSVAFSPDGQILASGSFDGTIILWDTATGEPLGPPLTDHTGGVWSVAFSPGGQTLASASEDQTIILWDVTTGQSLGSPLIGHNDPVTTIAFNPDGQTLASGSIDNVIMLWDVATGQPLGPPLTGEAFAVRSLAFSPDGQMLAAATDNTIVLWDVTTQRPLGAPITGHAEAIWSVTFSPDGQTLASSSVDGAIILWDVATRLALGPPLAGHYDAVWGVAFSPDGQMMASASSDNTVILWQLNPPHPLGRTLIGHEGAVHSVAFSPDGQTLVSGGGDKAIRFWDVETGQPLGPSLTDPQGIVWSVAFSPDGQTLAAGTGDKTIVLWDMTTGQPLGQPLAGHKGDVETVAFSPDGQVLASGSTDNTIILWDVATSQPLGPPLTGHTQRLTEVAFSPDGQILASGSQDETFMLWDVTTLQSIGQYSTDHSPLVASLAFSPDGRTLATGGEFETTLILWDAANIRALAGGQSLKALSKIDDTDGVRSLTYSPDGNILALGSSLNTVNLWAVVSGQPIASSLKGHSLPVTSVAFSSDGKILASASEDGTIILWDTSLESWQAQACRRTNRNLTRVEWQQFFGNQPYRPTCPDLPVPVE